MADNAELADRFEEKIERKLGYCERHIDGSWNYDTESRSLDFEIGICDEDTNLEAEISNSSEYNREFWPAGDAGEISLEVYDGEKLVYEACREVELKGSSLDEYVIFKDNETDTNSASSKMVGGLEDLTELAASLISEDSILRFEQRLDNSTPINNSVAQDMIDNQRNSINESNGSADRPFYWLGGPLTSDKYPDIRDDEAREKVRTSAEADKWRELGEDIVSGEKNISTVQNMIDNLENNQDKKITDFAI